MARSRESSLKYEMLCKVQSAGPIRGHHIYKDNWAPVIGEQLHCKHDPRDEARTFDKYALGICVYKLVDDEDTLVEHVLLELSQLLSLF